MRSDTIRSALNARSISYSLILRASPTGKIALSNGMYSEISVDRQALGTPLKGTEGLSTVDRYIGYYNNERIKLKLKGLSPVEYRTRATAAA